MLFISALLGTSYLIISKRNGFQSRLGSIFLIKSFRRARHPKSRRSFRNYMQNLCAMGFVRNVGEKRGRVYEIVNGILNHTHDGKDELCGMNKKAE
jgi:hypothetical protein